MVPCYGDCAGFDEWYGKNQKTASRNSFRELSKEEKDVIRTEVKEIISSLRKVKKKCRGLTAIVNDAIRHIEDIAKWN